MNDGCPINTGRMVNFPRLCSKMMSVQLKHKWLGRLSLQYFSFFSHLLAFYSLCARKHLINAYFSSLFSLFQCLDALCVCVCVFARSAPCVMSAMQSFFEILINANRSQNSTSYDG